MRNDVFAVLPIRFWETTGNSDVFILKEMVGGLLELAFGRGGTREGCSQQTVGALDMRSCTECIFSFFCCM